MAEEDKENTVFKHGKEQTKQIPLPEDLLQMAERDEDIEIRCIYPTTLETDYSYCKEKTYTGVSDKQEIYCPFVSCDSKEKRY